MILPDPLACFGQETDHTCAASCLRYLHFRHCGIRLTEAAVVPALLPDDPDGNTYAEVAQALTGLGYHVEMRCLHHAMTALGPGPPPTTIINPGSLTELELWLQQTVPGGSGPVMVGLNLRRLRAPFRASGIHSAVVLSMTATTVDLLDSEPPPRGPPYPKQAQRLTVPRADFLAAWRATYCLSLLAWK